jgi:hypothetical protein
LPLLKIKLILVSKVIKQITFNPKDKTFCLKALWLTRKIQKWIFGNVLDVSNPIKLTKEITMVWFTVRCSYADWQRDYKRSHAVEHDHPAQTNFVIDAKNAAVNELHTSGQPRFANVASNDIGTSGLRVNLPNDPGANYRQI